MINNNICIPDPYSYDLPTEERHKTKVHSDAHSIIRFSSIIYTINRIPKMTVLVSKSFKYGGKLFRRVAENQGRKIFQIYILK